MPDDSLSMVLTNTLSEIPRAAERVEAFCRAHCIPAGIVHRFQLALEEVLANAIAYAFSDADRHQIAVSIEFREGILTAKRPLWPSSAPAAISVLKLALSEPSCSSDMP